MIRQEKLDELHRYIEELKTIEIVSEKELNLFNRWELLKLLMSKKEKRKTFLNINQKLCRLNNGKTILREEIIKGKQRGDAVIVLPITKENDTLLVVQPRVSTKRTIGVEIVAGYIDPGETPVDAALRELREETGYVPEEIIPVGSYYQDQGCSGAYNHSYVALGCFKKYDQDLDKDEYIKYFECHYEEAIELTKRGYICDANSLLALEKSKTLLKRR